MAGPTEGNLNSTTPAPPSGKQNCIWQADAAFTDTLTGLPERDISIYPPSAAVGLEGAIAIAGDIGGTSTTPKVVGIQGVGVSATSPTNGQVLAYDSGSGLWKPTASGSGAAPTTDKYILGAADLTNLPNSVSIPSLWAGPDVVPASAGSIDDEFPGSSLSGSWTWVNQGTGGSAGAAAVANSFLALTGGNGANAPNVRYIYQTAPATPWRVAAKIQFTATALNTYHLGLCLADSSGKIVSLDISGGSTAAFGIEVNWWNSPTSFNATETSAWAFSGPVYMSIDDDGTNCIFKFSLDGSNWMTVLTQSRTAFLTSGPTRVGYMIDIENSNGAARGLLSSDWFRRTL